MIREQFVNFEIAKRLHELGFSTVTDCDWLNGISKWYVIKEFSTGVFCWNSITHKVGTVTTEFEPGHVIPMPTIQMALEFFRQEYKLHVDADYIDFLEHGEVWATKIVNMQTFEETKLEYRENSYSAAAIAGIEYCLGIAEKKAEEDFWKECKICTYFDNYDMCLHKRNFGSVTNESKERCKLFGLFEHK